MHESVLKSIQNPDSLAKQTLLMAETTCRSTKKVRNGECPTTWLLLQLDLMVFLLSRNLSKTGSVELVPRAAHRVVAYDMAGVTTIETEAIVMTMFVLGIG